MDEFLHTMVPDVPFTPSPMTPVATLAFLDLETTGLAYEIGKTNVQITELSIVAVDRTDFENDPHLRVQNKLDLFVRPRATISPGASSVTNLYNDLLEKQKPFDNSVPEMLNIFFKRLRSPICLLAHNGKQYDFPILKAEVERMGASLKVDVSYADTLQAFRSFGLVPADQTPIAKKNQVVETTCSQEVPSDAMEPALTDQDIDDMLDEDLEDFYDVVLDDDIETYKLVRHTTLPSNVNEVTPTKITENLPPKCTKKGFKQTYDGSLVRRQLFPDPRSLPKPKKPSYKLDNIYSHYFGELPVGSHQALSDCLNLCKVCQKVSQTFLPWLDANQKPFSDIISLW